MASLEVALTDVIRLRVRYSEGDQMGITYHARYLDWFVIGRTELLRSLGLPYAELERQGLLLPVLEVNCRYLGATRYDDVVQLETTLTEVGRTRMAFRYEAWLLPPGQAVCGASGSPPRRGADSLLVAGSRPISAAGAETAAGPRAAGGTEKPVLVTVGETRHVFVDEQHRPFDVRKRFPQVWELLEPLALRIRNKSG